jgi:putative cell wall-binding protein
VSPTEIPVATAAELSRLKPASIVVLGGQGVVPDAIAAQLAAFSPTVVRAAGPDRYATAAAVSAATFSPDVPVVFIATGKAFPDALAGAGAAAFQGSPLLLVDGATVPPSTLAELRRLKPRRIAVLGGPAVILESVLPQLRDVLANP